MDDIPEDVLRDALGDGARRSGRKTKVGWCQRSASVSIWDIFSLCLQSGAPPYPRNARSQKLTPVPISAQLELLCPPYNPA